MDKDTILIFDFDSTFVTVETLDLLAELKTDEKTAQKIAKITNDGMEGTISFQKSLNSRLALLSINKQDFPKIISELKNHISPSILRNKAFFKTYSKQIYVLSSGFVEFIVPVVAELEIAKSHVFANSFVFDKNGNATGVDKQNPLSKDNGKAKVISTNFKNKKLWMIGDGYTDYEVKRSGVAEKFFASTETIKRQNVVKNADVVLPSFDEFLYRYKLPRALSYPKTRMSVLLLEGIHPVATDMFEKEGYKVKRINRALTAGELEKEIRNISLLGIRSRTPVNADVINKARKLLAIGSFCIGTNNIDLTACSAKGIACFNAPYSNTRSVVELVVGFIVMLLRGLGDKNISLHKGTWCKTAVGSYELRGKKLGIIGYGNIGSQLSVVAETLGLEVYFYDILDKLVLGNARSCANMKELLQKADIVTIHVDGRDENKNLIGADEIALMKKGSFLINASRGYIVDTKAVAKAIKVEHLAGYSADVHPKEPKSNKDPFVSNLRGLPNVILTPHIGAATKEAQENIGKFSASKLISFINTGNTMLSVNMPNIVLSGQSNVHRVLHIHRNIPGVLASINSIFSKNKINIEGQYLKTNEQIGYVITDVNKEHGSDVIDQLKKVDGTIRVRVLY